MLGLIGVLLGYIGFAIYFVVHWKVSEGMDMGKRMIVGMYGFPTAFYGTILYVLFILYDFDMASIGISLFFMGMAFMVVNLGRAVPIAYVNRVLSKDSKAFSLSLIHVSLFEPNSIYVLLMAVLGMSLIRDVHMSYGVFNNATIYVSLGAMAAAILMGIVMRRMLENVETFEDMRQRMSRTILATVSVHSLAIVGMAMAIIALLPYME